MSDIVRMERVPGSEISRDVAIADEAADVVIASREVVAGGFRPYERLRARRGNDDAQTRDILRAGPAVAVLPIDLTRGEVVLIRQFRLAAHLANGKGDLLEIVAGRVEEIGVAPQVLVELLSYFTSPGLTDEEITLFLGIVDSARVRIDAGADAESEATALLRVPIDAALAPFSGGAVHTGPLVVALQWLALNRGRLAEIARTGTISR